MPDPTPADLARAFALPPVPPCDWALLEAQRVLVSPDTPDALKVRQARSLLVVYAAGRAARRSARAVRRGIRRHAKGGVK